MFGPPDNRITPDDRARVYALLGFGGADSACSIQASLDLLTLLAVGVIALFAIRENQPVFLDAAIALALVAFLGTVAYARFLERRGRHEHKSAPLEEQP